MENNFKDKYGTCECGNALYPTWFTLKETKVTSNGSLIHTGRTKQACSHLECPLCLKSYAVDDSFDAPWEKEK